jgi:hypothetical protein
MTNEDLPQLQEIHAKFYANEFPIEDLTNRFFETIVVEENGKIISACALRTLIEAVMITDKSSSARARRDALVQILIKSLLVAGQTGHNSVQAFVQDDNWEKQLKHYGFRECKGKALFIG